MGLTLWCRERGTAPGKESQQMEEGAANLRGTPGSQVESQKTEDVATKRSRKGNKVVKQL